MKEVTKKRIMEPCKNCHKKSYYISENGLCPGCVAEKVKLARCQIKSKEGPIYEKWKSNIINSLSKLT